MVDAAIRATRTDPRDLVRQAVEAECGFPPFERESREDYVARAAGVSRDRLDRYLARLKAGELLLPELADVHAFMDRMGRRIVAELHRRLADSRWCPK